MDNLPKDYPKDLQGNPAPIAVRYHIPAKFLPDGGMTGLTVTVGAKTLGEGIARIRSMGRTDDPEGCFEMWCDGGFWAQITPPSPTPAPPSEAPPR